MTRSARLSAIASYLPEEQLTNQMLVERYPEWTTEKIEDKTGIFSRRIAAEDEFTSDIAVKAAECLFETTGASKDEIDQVILVSVSPDYVYPATAALIQDQLGLPRTTGALDCTLGCSGYVYGLAMAAALVESGRADKVLLLTADKFSPYTDHGGFPVQVLFGDGGTASLVEAVDGDGPGLRVGASEFGTDGSGAEKIISRTSGMRGFTGNETVEGDKPTVEMDGPEVFSFASGVVPRHVKAFLGKQELTVDDVDLFVFHQANMFMIEHLRRKLRIPEEKFVKYMAEVGNTTASSIPLAFESAWERVTPGCRVLLTAFGVGLSWGSVLLESPA